MPDVREAIALGWTPMREQIMSAGVLGVGSEVRRPDPDDKREKVLSAITACLL